MTRRLLEFLFLALVTVLGGWASYSLVMWALGLFGCTAHGIAAGSTFAWLQSIGAKVGAQGLGHALLHFLGWTNQGIAAGSFAATIQAVGAKGALSTAAAVVVKATGAVASFFAGVGGIRLFRKSHLLDTESTESTGARSTETCLSIEIFILVELGTGSGCSQVRGALGTCSN